MHVLTCRLPVGCYFNCSVATFTFCEIIPNNLYSVDLFIFKKSNIEVVKVFIKHSDIVFVCNV